ncbi:MAG: prepilin-type N-terminal cleavage/methylation domain-containing protein [Candidatus Dadabacteria bacterium]|nr:MAG: prepilin-type N-terminal cleavage/methylation domain-containing protein [Candidatus Dadabacteria bacterium]
MKSRLIKSESGLTLVEIIVVLVILSLLMTFLLSRITGSGDKAKKSITKLKIKQIASAIEQYRLMNNQLPNTLEDLVRCNEVTGPGCIPPLNDEEALKDGWGNKFVYRTENNGRTYKIISYGADGVPGGQGVNYDEVGVGP